MTSSSKQQSRHHSSRSGSFDEIERTLRPLIKDEQKVSEILKKIQKWTGGEPFLSQLICSYVVKCAGQIDEEIAANIVDGIVEVKIVRNWRENAAAAFLKKVCEPIVNYNIRDSLLILYIQILQRGAIAPPKSHRESPEQEVLLNSGLVTLKNGQLQVANAIYAKVFDLKWVESLLPGITRPVSIVSKASSSKTRRSRSLLPAVGAACLGLALLAAYFGLSKGDEPTGAESAVPVTSARSVADDEIASPEAGQTLTRLTLLGDTFSGYSTFRNADFQSVLKETGIEINYANEFDQALRAEKLSNGEADLMVTTLDQFLQQRPKGKIVGLLDRTVGADAVVLNTKRYPELKSLLDVETVVKKAKQQGKTPGITYATDTPSEYLAMVLDAQFDAFDLSDFALKPSGDASEAWALMQNPTSGVAIAVLWEPYVTQARQKGYSVVLSSDDVPNTIIDVIVASDELMNTNPDVISRLLENYYRRIDANARDATQLQTQVAADGNLPVNEAITIINGIDFFTAIETQAWMNDDLLTKRIGTTAAVLALANRLEPAQAKSISAKANSLYTSQFVTEAASNTQTLIDLIRADNPALAEKLAGSSEDETKPEVTATQIQEASDIGNLKVRGEVSFTASAAELTTEGKQTLNQLASELKDFNGQKVAVRVIGHTSRTGNDALNQRLSEERARVVANHLKGMGVTMNVLPEGKGFSESLPNVDPAAAQNQRTEIRLVRVDGEIQ